MEIAEWADSLQRLLPDIDLEAMEFMIDNMKKGEIAYDKNAGIQNIFMGLKMVTRDEEGKLKVLKAIW